MSSRDSIENKICDYLEGTLRPEDQQAFEHRLASDPEALDLLCHHSLMGASMRSPLVADDHYAEILVAKQKRRAFGLSLAVAAAIALTTALVLHRIMVPPAEPVATIETTPGTAYSIQAAGKGEQDGALDYGETLVVSQGVAEVTLADGSRCLAEAPARITLHGPAHAHLSDGRAFFEIAEGSEGFQVSTSDLEIVDLGTAFGVDDRAEHQPQVHVFDGRVRATARSGRRESAELSKGEAVAVGGAGTLRPISCLESGFLRSLPSSLPAIRFSFEPTGDSRFEADGPIVQQESVRILNRPERPENPESIRGVSGRGLRLGDRTQFLETTWPGIGGAVPRTISFWVRFPEDSDGGSILDWGLFSGSRKMSHLRVTYSSDSRANLRLVSGRRWLQTTQRLDTGDWHHVAFIVDSPEGDQWPTVKCYVDGELEPLHPRVADEGEVAPLDSFEIITDHPESRPLTFGNRPPADRPEQEGTKPVVCEIDEVVVTAGILTETQIKTLAERP